MKKARDEYIGYKGEEHPDCVKLIEVHKACLREEGFNVNYHTKIPFCKLR